MTSKHKHSTLACILIALPLAFIAGYQVIGESRDYLNYLTFFDLVRSEGSYFEIFYRFEPGFTFISYWLAHIGFNNEWIYGLIVGFCVYLKYSALPVFHQNSIPFLVFTLLFLSRYFILFEMTVLRAAVAFSIAFVVFFKKQNDRFKVKEFCLLVLAILFHYSAIVFIPIYFIGKLSRMKVIVVSIVAFLLIYELKNFALNILPGIFPVFNTYDEIRAEATFLPVPLILDVLLGFFGLFFWGKNDLAMQYSILGIFSSIVFHFAVLDFSVISGRLSELLSVFVLIYVVRLSMQKSMAFKTAAIFFSILDGFMNLYVTTIHDPLLSW